MEKLFKTGDVVREITNQTPMTVDKYRRLGDKYRNIETDEVLMMYFDRCQLRRASAPQHKLVKHEKYN